MNKSSCSTIKLLLLNTQPSQITATFLMAVMQSKQNALLFPTDTISNDPRIIISKLIMLLIKNYI